VLDCARDEVVAASGKPKGTGADSTPSRFSQLSSERQLLVRLCQLVNFGEIRDIEVRNREPLLGSVSHLLVDVRLDSEESPRRESSLPDFSLCHEIRRLLAEFDRLENGRVSRIEIRAGLPRRIQFEAPVESLLR
jgi:hypothetical protein